MRNLLISAIVLSAFVFGACAAKSGPDTMLADTDPANSPAVVTRDLDDFKAIQNASFTLRVKNFMLADGQWAPGGDIGIVELEKAAIEHLKLAGYSYTPYPEKSRYNIEFHLTCFDPAGGHEISQAPDFMTLYPDDFAWGPYAVEEKTVVFTITPGEAQQAGPRSCSGRMLMMVRDRGEAGAGAVYAGHHNLTPCPYEQGCAFDACREPHKKEMLKYLDIVFTE